MINEKSIEKTKQILKQEESPKIVLAQNDEYNRKMLEHGKFDILLSPERGDRRTSLRQIDSGLNHFIVELAKKKNIAIGIDLNELRPLEKEEKAKRIEKIIQNIRFCRKKNIKLALFGVIDQKNTQSLLKSWGASSQQASQALAF
ncbi:MAG: hypothetical protein AABX11_05640 [Nanoarchaeota archaeon]